MTADGQRIASLDMKVAAAGPEIPEQAFILAAVYREAGKGPEDVAALGRLFGAVPHMWTSILAAWDTLDRIAAEAAEDGTR